MDEEYSIVYVDKPEQSAWGIIGRGVGDYNQQQTGDNKFQLLTLAEDEARQRGAKNVYLDTFSFQAPDFYKQHGYQVFGELEDFPPGHERYFLTKKL
jgi:hypothetical protein